MNKEDLEVAIDEVVKSSDSYSERAKMYGEIKRMLIDKQDNLLSNNNSLEELKAQLKESAKIHDVASMVSIVAGVFTPICGIIATKPGDIFSCLIFLSATATCATACAICEIVRYKFNKKAASTDEKIKENSINNETLNEVLQDLDVNMDANRKNQIFEAIQKGDI